MNEKMSQIAGIRTNFKISVMIYTKISYQKRLTNKRAVLETTFIQKVFRT